MQNPILQAVSKNNLTINLSKFKQLFEMIKSAGNPQAMFQQMMTNNPQYSQAMQMINENGGNAKKAFYAMAEKMGVNGDEIINAFK